MASTLSACKTTTPVAVGGGRNFLGTNTLPGFGSQPESFWLSISGYCGRREFGELVAAYADNNGGTSTAFGGVTSTPAFSCQPGTEGGPSYVRRSPTYNAAGYLYLVDTARATGPVTIQVYDPVVCGMPVESSAGPVTQQTSFRLYAGPSSSEPGTDIVQRTFTGADCSMKQTWWTMAEVDPAAGPYFIQVTAPAPTVPTTEDRLNQFALRAFADTWAPCTADPNLAVADIPLDEHCPSITAVGTMGAYVTLSGGTTSMPVGAIGATSAGRTLDVELFDAAERGRGIELIDPNGNAVTVQAEIACDDLTYLSQTGAAACATGETPPTESPAGSGLTYGPWTTDTFDNCGPVPACGANAESGGYPPAQQPWGYAHLVHRTQYSDRTIRLRAKLPTDYEARFGTRTQWSVRFTSAATAFSDRLTMRATIR